MIHGIPWVAYFIINYSKSLQVVNIDDLLDIPPR